MTIEGILRDPRLASGPPGDIMSEALLKAVYDIEMGILNVDGRRLILR